MEFSFYLIPFLAGLGLASGFLAGLLGVGGGIVLVPGLYYVFSASGFPPEALMHMAVGTSLAIIIPTGLSSTRAHFQHDSVDVGLARLHAPGILAGVAAGTFAASYLDGRMLQIIFAFALLFLAGVIASDLSRFHLVKKIPGQPWASMMGAVSGFLSTLIGIGGATINVPYMTLCHVPIRRAVGTAALLGVVISIPAAIGFAVIGWDVDGRPPYSFGYINFLAWIIILPFAVMMAPRGAHAAHNISVGGLRRSFSLFMVLVSLKLLYDAYAG